MEPIDSVPDLVRRWGDGDTVAAARLFDRYGQQLTRVAEQYLSRKLAGRVDGEDVVQSVFRTFFRRCTAGEFQIDSSGQLWHLLVKITVLKARAQGRYHSQQKRSVGAEAAPDDAALPEALARDPGPTEAAVLTDLIEAVMDGVPHLYCWVLEYRLRGWNPTEIAQELHISRNTVYRALDLLQQRLIACGEAGESEP